MKMLPKNGLFKTCFSLLAVVILCCRSL